MARDLAAMRRSVEQLAAKQEQMAQTITTLQAVEQDIKQKMSSLAPSQAVPIPPRKPPRPPTPSSTVRRRQRLPRPPWPDHPSQWYARGRSKLSTRQLFQEYFRVLQMRVSNSSVNRQFAGALTRSPNC